MERTLLEQVQEYIKENGKLNLPFYRVYDLVESTVSACGLGIGKPDFAWIELMKTIHFSIFALSNMNIKYEIKEFEKESVDETTTYDYYSAYDELKPIYDELFYSSNLYLADEILEKEIELAKDTWIKQGQFESEIIKLVERFTTVVEDISKTIQDEKKIGKLLKTISKNVPQLGELIKPK